MWLALTLALTITFADAARPLSFRLLEDGAIVVPVWVQGQGPFRFLLDTGASQSVIAEPLARRLHVAPRGRTSMVTPSGDRRSFAIGRLSRITVGAVMAADVAVTIVPADTLRSGATIDGIVGQDVLGRVVYTIDYRRRAIIWGSSEATSGIRLPLDVRQGRVLVTLRQTGEPESLRLVPDSGTDGLVLFARAGRRLPAATPLEVGVLRTVSGHRLVRRVLIDTFSAGGLRFQNLTAVVVPRADADGPDGDGLLPLHIFSGVTFNVPENFLVLQR